MGKVSPPKKRPELVKKGGCEGCVRKCLYNSPVTTKDNAQKTKNKPFKCNKSK